MDLLVPDGLIISSHKGDYSVSFVNRVLDKSETILAGDPHVLIDANVARIYKNELSKILSRPSTIVIESNEDAKSLTQVIPIIDQLVQNKIRRQNHLLAIGGGVVQDITCFIASILLRGIEWRFIPTTLLAQADSCIGSKSSINLASAKNIVGTFYPPRQIWIDKTFLATLSETELRSGLGEILKVHAIDSAQSFDDVASEGSELLRDFAMLEKRIYDSLLIKKRFIEIDEFDKGIRNIFNFGHSFGHAIEAATNFLVPHGIAVTMGMDIACHISHARSLISKDDYQRMSVALKSNYEPFRNVEIPLETMFNALAKDKKNTPTELGLIFPVGIESSIEMVKIAPDEIFRRQLADAVATLS